MENNNKSSKINTVEKVVSDKIDQMTSDIRAEAMFALIKCIKNDIKLYRKENKKRLKYKDIENILNDYLPKNTILK
jgi:hypothetical protein